MWRSPIWGRGKSILKIQIWGEKYLQWDFYHSNHPSSLPRVLVLQSPLPHTKFNLATAHECSAVRQAADGGCRNYLGSNNSVSNFCKARKRSSWAMTLAGVPSNTAKGTQPKKGKWKLPSLRQCIFFWNNVTTKMLQRSKEVNQGDLRASFFLNEGRTVTEN